MKTKTLLLTLTLGLLSACSSTKKASPDTVNQNIARGNVVREGQVYQPAWIRDQAQIDTVLTGNHYCAPNLLLRYQALSEADLSQTCVLLKETEDRFHQLFNTRGKPVRHDNNTVLRANIYASRDNYVKYVTDHFDVPSDNGGMYLEGLPHLEDSQAEYVAYLRNGQIWNLNHEFVHYLDGRFNTYGDYCLPPHDSHSGPEYCPKPAAKPPYTIWWSEGVAEYVAHGHDNPGATKLAKLYSFQLSELFNNAVANWSTERVYRWGYLAVRFMLEQERQKAEQMLFFMRTGDYARYQALVSGWGTSMDASFHQWLNTLED